MMPPTQPPASRRPLRIWFVALALLLAVAMTVAAGWLVWTPAPPLRLTDATLPDSPRPAPQDVLLHGAYLARLGNCAQCHTAPGGAAYAGGRGIATPFGKAYGGNLTPDPETGLGRWSPDDFWRTLHHGQSPTGRALIPVFPYTSFTHLARQDSDALYAYLQSLPAVRQAPPDQGLAWPYGTPWALKVWQAVNFTPAPVALEAPTMAVSVERGRYLVQGLGHCNECHGGRNLWGAPAAKQQLGGAVMPGMPWYAPPLTNTDQSQHSALDGWSDDDIASFLVQGRNDLAMASGPMADVVHHSTQYLQAQDAQSMARYLLSLQSPKPNPQPSALRELPAPSAAKTLGARVYEAQCAQCHGKQGEGKGGAFPALAGNRAVTTDNTNNLILMVLYGGFGPSTAGIPRPHGMPPFVLALNGAEIAAVISHVRTAWGNRATPISELDVHTIRSTYSPD
jgi:mono/diheme cytochrome c family protein